MIVNRLIEQCAEIANVRIHGSRRVDHIHSPPIAVWGYLFGALLLTGCRQEPANRAPVSSPPTVTASNVVNSPEVARAVSASLGIRFEDRTAASNLQFTYKNDEAHSDFAILESLGGGIAIFDFDGDGRCDLFLTGGGTFGDRQTAGLPSALFRNEGHWRFADVTKASGIGRSRYYSHGAAVADCNEDGFDDVLITGYGGLMLYQNQGDGSFREVTPETGLDDRLWSSSAAWGDFNADGALDVYVVHYVDWSFDKNPVCEGPPGHPREVCPPRQFDGLPDLLYFGNGDGTFRNGTKEARLQPDGKGLGVVAADLDQDGDLDLYVGNDTVPNFLYLNDGRGQFDDFSLISGSAHSDRGTPDGSMGTDVGDFNGDGLPEIWVANYEGENNALYRNLGKGLFRHVSQSTGISAVGAMHVGWGTRFVDVDLDGDEDLIVSNGHVVRFPVNTPRRQRPVLLENLDGARFRNVADRAGEYMTSEHAGRGLATGDMDGDGDEDIVISNLNEPAAVLSNESAPAHNWLAVRIIGRQSTRASIGATAVTKVGDRTLTRQIRGGSSYASTSDSKLHFGCGTMRVVDALTVTWIGGSRTVLQNVECNQVVTIVEPATTLE